MRNDPRGLGRALVHLASILLGLNIMGWLLVSMPLTLAPAFIVVWALGIVVHIFEPARLRPKKR